MKKIILCLFILSFSVRISAQTTDERFHDLFITSAYSTALGAAAGLAALGLSKFPSDHVNYIWIGASIGFFAGTLFGSYLIFAPTVGTVNNFSKNLNYYTTNTKPNFILRPNWNPDKNKISSFAIEFSYNNDLF